MSNEKAVTNWASNPILPYAVGGLLAALAVWAIVKVILSQTGKIYEGAKSGAVKVASDVVDAFGKTASELSSIAGKPKTELPGQQSLTDKAKGLLAGGDSRTWSDLLDF